MFSLRFSKWGMAAISLGMFAILFANLIEAMRYARTGSMWPGSSVGDLLQFLESCGMIVICIGFFFGRKVTENAEAEPESVPRCTSSKEMQQGNQESRLNFADLQRMMDSDSDPDSPARAPGYGHRRDLLGTDLTEFDGAGTDASPRKRMRFAELPRHDPQSSDPRYGNRDPLGDALAKLDRRPEEVAHMKGRTPQNGDTAESDGTPGEHMAFTAHEDKSRMGG